MLLLFDIEEFIRPLVSALYESSEGEMEVDCHSASVTVVEQEEVTDSDIEVLTCYRETPIYPPQLIKGRAMTFDLDTCGEERHNL